MGALVNAMTAGPSGIGKYVTPAALGDGVATVFTVTHNLNSLDVVCSGRDTGSGAILVAPITSRTVNTVVLTFGGAPTAGQYVVTVIG
jgi:acyl CoA:acetate/3-ketoacid CoA transferase alpha subunit